MTSKYGIKSAYLPITRQHVRAGARWAHEVGTDYWFQPTNVLDQFGSASTATGDELAENGWIATTVINTAGSGADFMGGGLTPTIGVGPQGKQLPVPSDMGVPNHGLLTTDSSLFGSPSIFGDYAGAYAAMKLAGKSQMPRFLIMETMAKFATASSAEVRSAFGFFQSGATFITEAHQYACIYSDGTNFFLAGQAAKMQTGPVVNTNWHHWKIVLEYKGTAGPNCYAYMDNAIFSATPGVGTQDLFPLAIGAASLTNNTPTLGLIHVYYDW